MDATVHLPYIDDVIDEEDGEICDEEEGSHSDEDLLVLMGIPLSAKEDSPLYPDLDRDFSIDEFRIMQCFRAAVQSHDATEFIVANADSPSSNGTIIQPETQRSDDPGISWIPAQLELPMWAVEMAFGK
jgi:hypothetical protein